MTEKEQRLLDLLVETAVLAETLGEHDLAARFTDDAFALQAEVDARV